jgi:hypothetical protein
MKKTKNTRSPSKNRKRSLGDVDLQQVRGGINDPPVPTDPRELEGWSNHNETLLRDRGSRRARRSR